MNRTRLIISRASLLFALALALALVTQIPPAYADLGTSPTIWLSSYQISWGDTVPITLIAGIGTSPTIDMNGKVIFYEEPIPDAPLEIYLNDLLVGTGKTGENGLFQTSFDASWLLPGVYPMIIKFVCPPICGESPDVQAIMTVEGEYGFPGFPSPINAGELNSVKAGQTVPIKWQITGEGGTPLGNLRWVKSLTSVPLLACGSGTVNPIAEADASGMSGLRYDTEAGQFVFTFQTEKGWAGTCRRLVLTLINDVTYTVDFRFR